MPSTRHEILVELFRNRGELAPELLRICAGLPVVHAGVAHASIDLSQVVSTEYRADVVVELSGTEGQTVAAVIVEVQLHVDADKPWSWPVYVAALRAKLRCPAFLIVLAPESAVARKARASIEIGHPGFQLTPLVVEFNDLPRIVDLEYARRLPELAILSAMAHPELDVAITAIGAIEQLPVDQKQLYLDVVLAKLPALVRTALEAHMQGYVYQSEFARRYYDQGRNEGLQEGRNEGLQEGRNEGLQEGRNEGREDGLRTAVVALARAALDIVTADDEAAIGALRGEAVLTGVIRALGQARSAAEARRAIERAAAQSGP